MPTLLPRLLLVASLGLASFTTVRAEGSHDPKGTLVPVKDAPAEWVAKAQASYPTEKCVVSDDKLGGEMGPPVDYVYKAEGKPDRLVRLCCKDCVKDFKIDPDKYLAEIDHAASKKAEKEHAH